MAPSATPDEIRAAYRRLARLQHPDLVGAEGSAGMAELNRAYRVLADPVTRHAYDRSLHDASTTAGRPRAVPDEPDTDDADPLPPRHPFSRVAGQALSPPGPARYPWRMVVLASVIGAALVIAVSASRGPARVPPPDGVLRPGVSCVVVEPNTDVREAVCERGAVNLVVEAIVDFGERCPTGLLGHRDRQGSGIACVAERVIER